MKSDKGLLALERCDELEKLIRRKFAALKIEDTPEENPDQIPPEEDIPAGDDTTVQDPSQQEDNAVITLDKMTTINLEDNTYASIFSYTTAAYKCPYGQGCIILDFDISGLGAVSAEDTTDYSMIEEDYTIEIFQNGRSIYKELKSSQAKLLHFGAVINCYIYQNPTGFCIKITHNKPTYFTISGFSLKIACEEEYSFSITPTLAPVPKTSYELFSYAVRNGLDGNDVDKKSYLLAVGAENNQAYILEQNADEFSLDKEPTHIITGLDDGYAVTVGYRSVRLSSTNFIYGSPKVFCSQSGVAKEIDLETGEIVENSIFAAKRKAIYSTHGHKLYANCCGYISYINDTGLEYGHASYVNTFSQAKGSIKMETYAINSFAMPYARSASEIMLDNVCFFDISGSLFHSTHTGSNVYAVANSPTNIEKVVSAIYATADATEVYLYVIIDKTLFRLTLNKSGSKYSYTMGSKVPVAYGISGYYPLLDDDAIIEYDGNIYFTKEGYNFWKE